MYEIKGKTRLFIVLRWVCEHTYPKGEIVQTNLEELYFSKEL